MFQPVDASFFRQPTLDLARSLLGMLLVCETDAGTASGWIVETEAYLGPEDRAAHSFGNRRTARTEVMFGPPGHAYTYVMHTHCLFNVVSGEEGLPHAVLVRAVEPYTGVELMYERRGSVARRDVDLTSGPGKLTKALGVTIEDYGRKLWEPPLYIALPSGKGASLGSPIDDPRKIGSTDGLDPLLLETAPSIAVGPRIGIDGSGEAKDYPWRFWVKGNRFVSR